MTIEPISLIRKVFINTFHVFHGSHLCQIAQVVICIYVAKVPNEVPKMSQSCSYYFVILISNSTFKVPTTSIPMDVPSVLKVVIK